MITKNSQKATKATKGGFLKSFVHFVCFCSIPLACVAADSERPRPRSAGVMGIEQPVRRKPAPPSFEAYTLEWQTFATAPQTPADIATVRLPGPLSVEYLSMLTTTNWPGCTGNLWRKAISMTLKLDVFGVEPPVLFASAWENADWNTCPALPSLRLFFTSVRGKYDVNTANDNPENYWWCCTDFGSWELTAVDDRGAFVEASISDPHQWTDALGRSATSSPALTAAFYNCVSNVAQIGLSGGGNCFYDTGVALQSDQGIAVLHVTGLEVW